MFFNLVIVGCFFLFQDVALLSVRFGVFNSWCKSDQSFEITQIYNSTINFATLRDKAGLTFDDSSYNLCQNYI